MKQMRQRLSTRDWSTGLAGIDRSGRTIGVTNGGSIGSFLLQLHGFQVV